MSVVVGGDEAMAEAMPEAVLVVTRTARDRQEQVECGLSGFNVSC